MTVLTVFSSPSGDGRVLSWDAVLANAQAGTGSTFSASTSDTTATGGQQLNAGLYKIEHCYFQWDTSSIPDGAVISNAVISLWSAADLYVDTAHVSEIRLYDWGASLTTADWVAAGSLSGLTRLCTYSVGTGESSGVYRSYTNDGTNLIDNINKTGNTSVLMSSDRVAAGNTPTNREFFDVAMADTTGTTNDPKLVVTYTATTDYKLTAAQGSLTETGETAVLTKTLHLASGIGTFGIPSFGGLPNTFTILRYGRHLTSAQGSITLTGEDTGLHAIRRLIVDTGSFSLSGQDAVFAAHDHVLSAETGVYALNGQDAALHAIRQFIVDGSSYDLTGNDADLVYGHRLQAIRTVFFVDGQDADLTFAFNGHDFTLHVDSGSYAVDGQDANLFRTPRPIVIPPAGGGGGGGGGISGVSGLFTRSNGQRSRQVKDRDTAQNHRVLADGGRFSFFGYAATLTVDSVVVQPSAFADAPQPEEPKPIGKKAAKPKASHYQLRAGAGKVGIITGVTQDTLCRASPFVEMVEPIYAHTPMQPRPRPPKKPIPVATASTTTVAWNDDEDLRLLFGESWSEIDEGDSIEDLILIGM